MRRVLAVRRPDGAVSADALSICGTLPSECPMCAPRNPGLTQKVSPCRWAAQFGAQANFLCVGCAGPQLAAEMGKQMKLRSCVNGFVA
eukprot:SAG31_NODE_15309_length_761_cov_0.918429_1_plen_87_part_10